MKKNSQLLIEALKEKEERKKKRRIKIFLFLFVFLLGIFVVTLLFISPAKLLKYSSIITSLSSREKYFEGKTHIKVLILGIDQVVKPARTDTIILANIDFKNKLSHLISIPRDTLVEIPKSKKKKDKINHAYAIGGIELTKKTLEKFLDTKIDYYVLTDFEKFKKIIDIIGGVEIDVEKRMHYIDRAANLYIDLYPGRQRLNGEKAMEYVRFRHDALGDIGRIERQQKFIGAVISQCKGKNIVKELPKIIKEIYKNIETDLKMEQILNLAYLLNEFEDVRIAKGTIPGRPVNIKGICYWEPDEEKTKELLTLFFKGIKVEIINSSGDIEKERLVARKLKEKGFRVINISPGKNLEEESVLIAHTEAGEVGLKFLKELEVEEKKIPENKGVDITFLVGKELKLKGGEKD